MRDQIHEPDSQRFQATRWSMVLRTRGDTPIARKALEDSKVYYHFEKWKKHIDPESKLPLLEVVLKN
jgi:hypothetical protein